MAVRPTGVGRLVWESLQTVLIALGVALLVRFFVVENFIVQGNSMLPTLHNDEQLLVDKLSYRLRPPARGEIVVFAAPGDPSVDFVKRVIAVPGERVELRDGVVYVDGKPLREPYVELRDHSDMHPVEVEEGEIFVLGDNRANSQDSRYIGNIPLRLVRGKGWLVWWPPDSFRFYGGRPSDEEFFASRSAG